MGLISCAKSAGPGDVCSWDPDFQVNWQRASSLVADAMCSSPPSPEQQAAAHALRLELLEHVQSTTANATCAAYVADDFEFIIGAAQLEIDDPWIDALWETYFHGRCPYSRAE